MFPSDDVPLPHQVKGADKLHPREVCAVQLGHHGAVLRPVEGTHQDGFHHVVKMVAQGDLIAAQLLGMAVQVPPAHPGAEVAGGFGDVRNHVEDLALEEVDGDFHKGGIAEDQFPVGGAVAGIHNQKLQVEGDLAMAVQLLHTLGQEHGILTPGDTDGDPVPLLDEGIVLDPADEAVPNGFAVLGDKAAFDLLAGRERGPVGHGRTSCWGDGGASLCGLYRSRPRKKRATTPGPVWAPITGPT